MNCPFGYFHAGNKSIAPNNPVLVNNKVNKTYKNRITHVGNKKKV